MSEKFSLLVKVSIVLFLILAVSFTGEAYERDWEDLSGEELEVAAMWTGDDEDIFNDVLDRFSELTGVEASYTPIGENLATVLGTRIEGGNPPDVAMLPQPGLLEEFALNDELYALDDDSKQIVDEYYEDVWKDLGSVNDELYGVWYKAANKSLMWYNTNVFDEAGVEEPENWEELMEVAETIEFYGLPPFSTGGGSSWVLTDWFENAYLRIAGPEKYDQLTEHEIPWTHETVKESLEVLKDIFGRPEWLAGGIEGSLEANHPEGIIKPFQDPPQAAIAYGADFSAAAIENETDAVLGDDAVFFEFPSINNSPTSVVGGGDVAVNLTGTDASREFMKFLATPEAAEIWAEQGGFTTPNQGVDPEVYPTAILRDSAEMLQEAEAFRFSLSDLQPAQFGSTEGTGMRFWFQEFLRNPDIEATAEGLEKDALEVFED